MRTILFCIPVLLLVGCTGVPPGAWTVDPTRPAPKATLSTSEAVALTDKMAQLQLQRNEIRGRIAVLYSNKDYSSEWSYHPDNKRFLSVDNTKFAVNLVVYAMTR